MSRRVIGVVVLAAVAVSACGGNDENRQAELADLFVESPTRTTNSRMR